MNVDRVKSSIRAMLNLANDNAASQGEIDNAMRFVRKLMDEHNLTDEDVSAVDEKMLNLERAELGEKRIKRGLQAVAWHGYAASFVVELIGTVKCYLSAKTPERIDGIIQIDPKSGNPKYCKYFVFYGIDEEAALAAEIFDELIMTVSSMARLKFGKVVRGEGYDYCCGFIDGLASQLQRVKLPAASTSTALVVARNDIVDKKLALADDYLQKSTGSKKFRKGRSGRATGGSAYREGHEDGKTHQVVVERKRKLTA